MIGISPATYRKQEGKLFPVARRLDSGFRAFTEEEVSALLDGNARRLLDSIAKR